MGWTIHQSRFRVRHGAALMWLMLWLALAQAPAQAAEAQFPTPGALRPDIDFWKRIYAEIDSDGGLLHDHTDLSIVYERIDFEQGITPRQRQKQVDRRKAHYAALLRQLAAGPESASAEARALLALWADPPDAGTLRAAVQRMRFQLGQADHFRRGLVRAGAFEDFVRRTMISHDIPVELGLLPLVESSYNHLARSRLGAAGMWQFTRSTGRRYMRIDRIVDERIDPYRSTEAAARLLRQNYKLTGNWPLAITAYNHGVAGIRRAVRKLGSDRIEDLVRNYRSRRFGFASRNFYVAFAAAMEVARDAERHFGALDKAPPLSGATLQIPNYVGVASVARALDLSLDTLRELNPALRGLIWEGRKHLPKGYQLRVPEGLGGEAGAQMLAQVPAEDWYASQHVDKLHRVRRGQTLSGIANEYGVSTVELARYNGLGDRDLIRIGQVLHLPQGVGTQAEAPPPSGRYQVRRGDNLSLIAARFGLDAQELAQVNGLRDANLLRPGDLLVLGEAERGETAIEADVADAATADAGGIESTTLEDVAGNQPPEPDVTTDVVSLDDPTDYSVAADGSIEIQVLETLGHYAAWASTNIADLRRLNGYGPRRLLVVGRRLQLDLDAHEVALFERRRTAFHRRVQAAYFNRYEVTGTQEHRVRDGDSLWILAQRHYGLPVWLLRQYNPDLNPDRVRAGTRLVIPQVARRQSDHNDKNTETSG